MSEPVTNVQIEDVLSSIRRLVSDESRPRLRPGPADEPSRPDRLVLTPSLLVPDSVKADGTQMGPSDDPGSDGSGTDPDDKGKSVSETDTCLDLSEFAQDGEQAEEPASEITDAPWRDPDVTLYAAEESARESTGAEDDQHIDAANLQPENSASAQADSLAGAHDTFDSQSGETEAAATDWIDTVEDGADQEPDTGQIALDAREDGPASEADDPGGDPADDEPYNSATLGDKIAALEAKIGQTQDQWEPDGELGDDYAGTRVETIEWRDHDVDDMTPEYPAKPGPDFAGDDAGTEPDRAAEPASQAKLNPDDDMLDIMVEDDTILDEESLRELVADIVRQELQGALGERITRNVRKLVRREIHRALTAQELD